MRYISGSHKTVWYKMIQSCTFPWNSLISRRPVTFQHSNTLYNVFKAFKAQNTPTQLHPKNFKPPKTSLKHPCGIRFSRVFSPTGTGGPIQRNCTNAVLCEDLCSPRFQRSKCAKSEPFNLSYPVKLGVLPGTH